MRGMQPTPPHTVERCQVLLERWRNQLQLSAKERGLLGGDLRLLDRQLQRLQQRRLRIALFGRVGVGKSSLINALIHRPLLQTDVAHGSTRRQQAVDWPMDIAGLTRVELWTPLESMKLMPPGGLDWPPVWPWEPTWYCWCWTAT